MVAQSIIEKRWPVGVIPGASFHDEFTGDALDAARWTFSNIAGTGSGAMSDEKDGGYTITTAALSGDSSMINHNDINHYAHDGAILLARAKMTEATSYYQIFGFTEKISNTADTGAYVQNDTNFGTMYLGSLLNTAVSNTALSSSPTDTPFNSKLRLDTGSLKCWINGNLEGIITSNLPDVALQPYFRQGTRTTAARTGHVLFMEAYNT